MDVRFLLCCYLSGLSMGRSISLRESNARLVKMGLSRGVWLPIAVSNCTTVMILEKPGSDRFCRVFFMGGCQSLENACEWRLGCSLGDSSFAVTVSSAFPVVTGFSLVFSTDALTGVSSVPSTSMRCR